MKLYLKGERCFKEKCSFETRKGKIPGQHGAAKAKKPTGYALQLREKQKVKRIYGVLEKQFSLYFKRADAKKGVTGHNLLAFLESRLDNVVFRLGFCPSRAAARQMVLHGHILVNGKTTGPNCVIHAGDTITVKLYRTEINGSIYPDSTNRRQRPPLKSAILFEGAGFLILNKEAGIAVHGRKSLEEQVLSFLMPKIPPSLSFKPGPLHRLDKPSSGVIVFSTSLEGAKSFSSLMRERKIKKVYLALVEGHVGKSEIWQDELLRDTNKRKTLTRPSRDGEAPGGFKPGLTRVRALAHNSGYTLIRAEIETGRTHQIRAQAASHGHPLAGDRKYGGRVLAKKSGCGFLLHAWRMEFPVEAGLPLPRVIEAPLPEYFQKTITELFGNVTLL